MKAILTFFLSLLLNLSIWSQLTGPEAKWLGKHDAGFGSEKQYDFSALGKALKGRRIVALGESSHGLGACYALKAAMVQYLHSLLGYEVLAMEGGLGDVNLAWRDADSLSMEELRDKTVFGNFRAKEVEPLFAYLKSQRSAEQPLDYAGFDSQTSSDYFYQRLQEVIAHFDRSLADSVQGHYMHYALWFQSGMQEDSVAYYHHQQQFQQKADAFKKVLTDQREFIVGEVLAPAEWKVMVRTLEGFHQSVELTFAERWRGVGLRDQLMAENLHWLIDSVYAGKKVIIWAHNGHVERGPITNGFFKWMGHFLGEWYGDQYYSLGIFALEGNVYQHWTRQSQPFDHTGSDCLESRLAQSGKALPFLDLRRIPRCPASEWLWNPIDGHEPENGGVVNFVPATRFDGVVLIRHSDIPTY
jgi:erythromycin esterase